MKNEIMSWFQSAEIGFELNWIELMIVNVKDEVEGWKWKGKINWIMYESFNQPT